MCNFFIHVYQLKLIPPTGIDLIKNISRNFNNKPNMRDIVVNRESCSPLVSVKKEAAIKPPSSILSST